MTTPARILFVDDNASIRQLGRIALERAGYEVTTATDGVDAMVLLNSQTFDAVVSDLDMPRANGLELLAEVRRLQPGAGIVAMSGEWIVGQTDVRQLAASGLEVQHFLTKPFALQVLRDAVSRCLPQAQPA